MSQPISYLYSLPIGWRRDVVKNGDIPSRDEHVFAYEMDYDSENPDRQSFAYNKIKGVVKIREAFVTGYGIPHERYTCRTWDGRSPLQQCKFPFKVQVKTIFKMRPHCLKITENVAFQFLNFGISHQFLSY